MDLRDRVESIASRDDLVEFIHALHEDLVTNPDEWENPSLERFLHALARWTESMHNVYANIGLVMPPTPDWRMIGRMLLAARIYE